MNRIRNDHPGSHPGGTARFTPEQRATVFDCLTVAERCLEEFYRFSPREWFHYSYTLMTAGDLPDGFPPRPANVFGEIQKNPERPPAGGGAEPNAGYTIVLFDGNILLHLSGHPDVSFRHLMLYILAHELVHIARFHHARPFDTPEIEKENEERTVHAITGRVLARLGDDQLVRLADNYLSEEYSL